MKRFRTVILSTAVALISGWPLRGQTAKTPPEESQPTAEQGLLLAAQGKCKEALLALRKGTSQHGSKEARMQAGVKIVECALSRRQTDTALEAIQLLNREFPHEPDVLYITTHAYSDLSTRASLELARTAPNSYQAHELNAEVLEMQGKWDEAASEYSLILKQQPGLPGIHYRLGRIILSRPATATTAEDARKEFEAELKIDPKNAGAEYVLGELSRQTQQWNDAIEHFGRASKLDASFADAFVGLGFSLNSEGRYAEAIPALEIGVRLQPANPTAHYQLTVAYGKTGRKEDAEREMALFQQTSEQATKQMHGEGQRPSAQPQ